MSTIAWDGETLAADRKVVVGTINDCETRKIAAGPDGAIAGGSGNLFSVAAFLRWVEAGRQGARPSLSERDLCLVINSDGALDLHDEKGWARVEARFYAMGSGAEFALSAMNAGASAEDAVRAAARFDAYTGSKIDSLRASFAPPEQANRTKE